MKYFKYYLALLIVLFFLLLICHFITWPIVMYDSDLWYHLSGGRFFCNNGSIAHNSFFSYISPSKEYYNYYWLFQVIVYSVYQFVDYYGLIVLRCLLYSLTAFFILKILFFNQQDRTTLFLGLLAFVCCTIVLLNRELAVRPHLFSYLFIVLFISIIEYYKRMCVCLPLIGIIWSNVHGIEYPVMFLIVTAYLVEAYWTQVKSKSNVSSEERKYKWYLIAVYYSIFITPGIFELVHIPFSVTYEGAAYQHLYVRELFRIPLISLFVFAPISAQGLLTTMQNLIVIITICFLIFGIYKRELRISHAILVVGAIFLLTRHSRFTCEFTLLSLPLLRHTIPLLSKTFVISSRVICVLLPVVLVIMPYCIYDAVLGNRPHYPLSPSNLPTGVSRFLKQHSLSGNILNDPNTGGYLQWTLSDRYRIYMDMQMSIFNDLDLALVEHSFTDKHAFASFIKKYDPSFITVSLNRTSFKDIINTQEHYCPVFFDHAEVLYVNRNHYKEIADKYELKHIDPFIYWKTLYANESATSISEISNEAKRIRSDDPSNFRINHILSSISVTRGEYREALEYAKQIIKYYPEQYQGYALMGDALFGTKEYREAMGHYKMALAMGAKKQSDKVYWNLYASYYNMREYRKAYSVLMKYVNPFSPEATYEEIYQLAISADVLGKKNEALLFFKIASMKIPDSENILKVKVDDYIKQLTNDDK